MTLGEIYRQINSVFSDANLSEQKIYHTDTTNYINQLIAQLRVDYIKNGLGYEFSETETFTPSSKDTNYSFVYASTLSKKLLRSLPIGWTVQQTLFFKTSEELTDSSQSWSQGDLAYKGDYVYKALSDISSTNTYDLTFEVDNVRDKNADLDFSEGDISSDGTTFYRYESGSWVELYWRKVDTRYKQGRQVPFGQLHELRLKNNWEHYPFAIKEDTIYTLDTTEFVVDYIPEWTFVEDLSVELNIPDSLTQTIVDQTVSRLANKYGVQLEQGSE